MHAQLRKVTQQYAELIEVTNTRTFNETGIDTVSNAELNTDFNKEVLYLRLERAVFNQLDGNQSATISRYGIWAAAIRDRLRYLVYHIDEFDAGKLREQLAMLSDSLATYIDIQDLFDGMSNLKAQMLAFSEDVESR